MPTWASQFFNRLPRFLLQQHPINICHFRHSVDNTDSTLSHLLIQPSQRSDLEKCWAFEALPLSLSFGNFVSLLN